MNPNKKSGNLSSSHWPLLDISRGLCCLAVLLFHSLNTVEPEDLHPSLLIVQFFTRDGWMAVHLFFVISGWCMAGRLSYSIKKGEKISDFLLSRAFRIFPLYWMVLILSLLLRLLATFANGASFSGQFPHSFSAGFSDIFLLYELSAEKPYLAVAWTLGIEILFYLACAFGLFFWKKGCSAFNILLASLGITIALSVFSFPICKNLVACWPHFLWGILAWRICARTSGNSKFYALLVFSILFLIFRGSWVMADTFTSLFVLLLLFCYKGGIRGDTFIPGKILVGLGTISYSLYLIHVPVLSPLMNITKRFVPPSNPLFVGIWGLAVAASILSAWWLYAFVEKRVETLRKSYFPSSNPA